MGFWDMSKGFAGKRKFGGKTYDLQERADTKAEANQDAKELRHKGRLVRIVPARMTGGRRVYLLYTRFG